MSWSAPLTNLRGILAMLYPTLADALRVVEDAGLNINFIAFDHKAINNWHNILTEAEKRNKVQAILQVVRNEYGENLEFIQAYQAYLGTMEQTAPSSSSDPSPARAAQSSVARAQPIKILFLAANPRDTTPLRLDEEVRAIGQALRRAALGEQFELLQEWAVRYTDLQELLLRHQPDIVHFSGHGAEGDQIILVNDAGESHLVSGKALASLFAVLKDNVRCVVFNACFSQPEAELIAQHIDVVIGMSSIINDEAAINFASAFYQALAYGRNFKTAFDLGRIQLDLANLAEHDVPQLLARRGDPTQITLTRPTTNQSPTPPANPGKYNITINNAQGLVIGDNAQVTQNVGTQVNTGGGTYVDGNVDTGGGDFVGRDKRSGKISEANYEEPEMMKSLQELLTQHQRNLLKLQQKKAIYAAGEEPLYLSNQIEQEEQEIAKLKAKLGQG